MAKGEMLSISEALKTPMTVRIFCRTCEAQFTVAHNPLYADLCPQCRKPARSANPATPERPMSGDCVHIGDFNGIPLIVDRSMKPGTVELRPTPRGKIVSIYCASGCYLDNPDAIERAALRARSMEG